MTNPKTPNKKSIYLTCSKEIDVVTHKPFKEVWIHFSGLDGVACGINLNRLLSKSRLSSSSRKCDVNSRLAILYFEEK